MSIFYYIENEADKWYDDFLKIYSVSFPVYEQRSHAQQLYAFQNPHYRLYGRINENRLEAFISFWEFDDYIYIEHLAVNGEIRGKQIGTNTLNQFKDEMDKTIVLEIDPIVDEVSAKRLSFYQKLDFKQCPYKHAHPAYNKEYKPHELLVLSSGKVLSPEVYETFRSDLSDVVMSDGNA